MVHLVYIYNQSVTVWLGKRGRREKKSKEKEWVEKVNWSEKAKEEFRKRTEVIELRKGGVNDEMKKLIERIKEMIRMTKRRKRKRRWDGECKRKKRDVKRTLKKWKRGNMREDYRRERREYRELCKRKRKQKNEK